MISPLLQTSMSSATLLRSNGPLPRRCRPHYQIRTLRLGIWSTYLEPNLQKEVRKRHRELKHTYRGFFSLKPSAEKDVDGHGLARAKGLLNQQVGLKGFMCSAWRGQDRPSKGERMSDRHYRTEETARRVHACKPPADISNILNVRRRRTEELIQTGDQFFRKIGHESFRTRSPICVSQRSVKMWETASSNGPAEDLGEIDPITNRRVYKNKSSESPASSVHTIPDTMWTTAKEARTFIPEDGHAPEKANLDREFLNDFEGNYHKPVYGYEPDGQKPETLDPVREGLSDYDAVTQYGVAEERLGPNKTQPDPVQEGLSDYDTVTQYGVAEENPCPSDNLPPYSTQEGISDYDEITKYGVAEEKQGPDATSPACAVEKALSDYDRAVKYGAAEELSESKSNYPVQEGLKDYDRMVCYGPVRSHEQDGQAFRLPASLDEPIEPALAKLMESDILNQSESHLEQGQAVAGNISHKGQSRKETRAEKRARRQKLESDFQKSQELETINPVEFRQHLAKNRDELTVRKPQSECTLTGNFGRDFPDEAHATWKHENEKGGSGQWTVENITPPSTVKHSFDECRQRMASETKPFKLELSMDRVARSLSPKSGGTSGGKEQMLENERKEKHKELVREIRVIYEDQYGSIAGMHRQVADTSKSTPTSEVVQKSIPATEPLEPTMYKILAYDPTMQSISTADTTSIVADSASPLTPAEVLLRLSNPTKFFPHFEPLQSQGYEIVSGSGDVLVFRKVRQAGSGPQGSKSESTSSYQNRTRHSITTPDGRNPIDGMRPIATAAGNFASPTGFVNYDPPESHDPPFKSNIDVRREEVVFSGKANWSEDGEKKRKKPGLAKRVLFGGAVFGGVSYAVGVVAEYFKSGGSDGKGPQGF